MKETKELSVELLTAFANSAFTYVAFIDSIPEEKAHARPLLDVISEEAFLVGKLAINLLADLVFSELLPLYEVDLFDLQLSESVLTSSLDVLERIAENLQEESARLLQQCFLERTISAYIQCLGRTPGKAAARGVDKIPNLLE